MSTKSIITGNPIEVQWFEQAKARNMPPMRYEVLVFDSKNEPMIGTIVTSLRLEQFCQESGLILGCVHAKRPAFPGEKTELI